MNTKEFIEKAINVHGDKYDYSKVEYIKCRNKVCIICPKHGEFLQAPSDHLSGCGCPKCSRRNTKFTTEEFIKKAQEIHGNKYDYSKVKYVNAHTKVCIICPKHGEFWQAPYLHINDKNGCPKCFNEIIGLNKRLSTEEFIKRAKEIHGNKYDYSKVKYITNNVKVCIICPKHGEFWQTPVHHLINQGCPKCAESFLEETVRVFLEKEKIVYEYQKGFTWLRNKKPMKIDFYLPKYNIAIECQGIQHYKPIDFGGKGKKWASDKLKETKERDKLKKELCDANKIKIIYFNYNDKINTLKSKIL